MAALRGLDAMARWIVAWSAGLLLAMTGCHTARGAGAATRMPWGRPAVNPGVAEGYWIWQDRAGWHLRATSDVRHRFQGSVESVDGILSDVRSVGTPPGALAPGTRRIDFDWQAVGGETGFDWQVSSGCNRFDLYIDGIARTTRVFLGEPEDSPYRMPFAVCRAWGVRTY